MDAKLKKYIILVVISVFVFSLISNAIAILLTHIGPLSYYDFPDHFHLFYGLKILLSLAAFLLIPISVLGYFFSRTRWVSIGVLISCCLYLSVSYASLYINDMVYMKKVRGLVEVVSPVVEAINEYNIKYGKPPESLEKLVPDFIHEIPDTGIEPPEGLRYTVGNEAIEYYDGNQWCLAVYITSGNWLLYLPNQNYSEKEVEKIGDWSYQVDGQRIIF